MGRMLFFRTIRAILSFVFFAAGIAKLVGLPLAVIPFDVIGAGQWFRYLTGLIEFGGALLLLTSRFVGVGGLMLAVTMIGAVAAHLTVVPGTPLPAAVFLVVNLSIVWNYRTRFFKKSRGSQVFDATI
ncbi:DoxX family protein [Sphingomonas sp. UV9]|uniref:DoxX family protein n=1 Tax=Sphingomonas sp. UV9 TaxID=1851410 RepID=UPI0019D015AB|nr:DoxX family protein [Sphingomonas sp. UV9]